MIHTVKITTGKAREWLKTSRELTHITNFHYSHVMFDIENLNQNKKFCFCDPSQVFGDHITMVNITAQVIVLN